MAVAQPHKELRFTRAAQAKPFWLAAAMLAAITATLLAVAPYRSENPALPHPLWALAPLAPCVLCVRTAIRCTKHAYLILSPLGVEVFPFFKPADGMRMIPWGQITGVEVGERSVTLHFDRDHSSGVHLSITPIEKSRRPLLAQALEGRIGRAS